MLQPAPVFPIFTIIYNSANTIPKCNQQKASYSQLPCGQTSNNCKTRECLTYGCNFPYPRKMKMGWICHQEIITFIYTETWKCHMSPWDTSPMQCLVLRWLNHMRNALSFIWSLTFVWFQTMNKRFWWLNMKKFSFANDVKWFPFAYSGSKQEKQNAENEKLITALISTDS